jgi:hypothetical protein
VLAVAHQLVHVAGLKVVAQLATCTSCPHTRPWWWWNGQAVATMDNLVETEVG